MKKPRFKQRNTVINKVFPAGERKLRFALIVFSVSILMRILGYIEAGHLVSIIVACLTYYLAGNGIDKYYYTNGYYDPMGGYEPNYNERKRRRT